MARPVATRVFSASSSRSDWLRIFHSLLQVLNEAFLSVWNRESGNRVHLVLLAQTMEDNVNGARFSQTNSTRFPRAT